MPSAPVPKDDAKCCWTCGINQLSIFWDCIQTGKQRKAIFINKLVIYKQYYYNTVTILARYLYIIYNNLKIKILCF